jgi:Ca2+-binding RTX toxin-like protein
MRRNKFKTRKFERLEDRRMMTTVNVDDGVLFIEGSEDRDLIVIENALDNGDPVVKVTITNLDDLDDDPRVEIRDEQITRIEVHGLEGDDTIRNQTDLGAQMFGESGNDTLESGDGNDEFRGGVGNDIMIGGRGDDTYFFEGLNPGRDEVHEAANVDTDTLDFSGFQSFINANLANSFSAANPNAVAVNAFMSNLQVKLSSSTGIEDVVGSNSTDHITGNSRPNHLEGGGDNDRLNGAGGNDILEGQAGNDTYEFTGTNLGTDEVREDANTGEDHLRFTGMTTGLTIDVSKSGPEFAVNTGNLRLILSNESAIEKVTGTHFGDSITGNSRNNTLRGVGGADAIQGLGGADTLEGGEGDDFLSTDALDVAFGGLGRDSFDIFTEDPTRPNPRATRYLDWGLL